MSQASSMSKALFLDIDGVLNTSGSCLALTGRKWGSKHADAMEKLTALAGINGELPYLVTHTANTIDPTAVELVNRLFDKEPNLMLVLSTSHRTLFNHLGFGSELHLKALDLYAKVLGLRASVFGITPVIVGPRSKEVATFLEQHPEINTHLAIDDGNDFSQCDCIFLRIDPSVGFTGKDYFQATLELDISESSII